jgi:hypothetical protein
MKQPSWYPPLVFEFGENGSFGSLRTHIFKEPQIAENFDLYYFKEPAWFQFFTFQSCMFFTRSIMSEHKINSYMSLVLVLRALSCVAVVNRFFELGVVISNTSFFVEHI